MRIKEQFEIEPNSKTKLYTPLTGLNADKMVHMVLSNGFVPEHVRYNTIIWDNWDIFSKSIYIWTVVRKQPLAVKVWTEVNDRINVCFVCLPTSKEKDMYEVKYIDPLTKRGMLLKGNPKINIEKFDWPVSLKEAVERTDQYLHLNKSKGSGMEKNSFYSWVFFDEYDQYNFRTEDEVEIAFKKHYLRLFQEVGVDEVSMQQLIYQRNTDILYEALNTFQDIEPDENTLKAVLGDYKYAYLFTKRELEKIQEVQRYNREMSQQMQYNKIWLMRYKIETQKESKMSK